MALAQLFVPAAGAAGSESAAVAPDPFISAASRIGLPLYRPATIPEGFAFSDLQLVTAPEDMLIVTYFSNDGREITLMESSPEGLDCPDCPTIDIAGSPAPYEVSKSEDGATLVDLTVTREGVAVMIGLRGKAGMTTNDALLTLRTVAESLQKVKPGTGASRVDDSQKPVPAGLRDAAQQASFPVYEPAKLPEYFYLKTVSYTPKGLASDGKLSTPEQLLITYAAGAKEIHLLLQPAGAFQMSAIAGHRLQIDGRAAVLASGSTGPVLTVNLGQCLAVLSGGVQPATLQSVARSLRLIEIPKP
ncbi:MAG: hypothetical protein IT209_05315 [Armatimonadetes bacterium]|nr:hypothetical protein [Armatimonadota bacterium]